MPVYLCQPGEGHTDPWRHGVQVFAHPCPIESSTTPSTQTGSSGERDLVVASWTTTLDDDDDAHNDEVQNINSNRLTTANAVVNLQAAGRGTRRPSMALQSIRRVRHAELVLIDDVCIAYNRYWLRLRWPGHKGGFAGYIAMGLVSETTRSSSSAGEGISLRSFFPSEDRAVSDDMDLDDPTREETGSMPPAEPDEMTPSTLTCARTGLPFVTSPAMKLLAIYDDGMVPPVALAPLPTESVFCRICREGLHDDADEELPAAEADEGADLQRKGSRSVKTEGSADQVGIERSSADRMKGPVIPHPAYSLNADAVQNPMLAPCECSGSMAFVHYLCVEQWRCRSRHPDAHNGLNCETCGAIYALPPPAEREVHMAQIDQDQEDWLEAMPPHVMQALRQPHVWWQIGAAIVRRRWLRPVAPVLMSPIVALYCRARRMLKKRGVARRRWACSLCRRRARWKCVRCLRSYYCSRQCQNVSWHIIHKHVCYKPVRFWWSVIVYTAVALALFPGILRDPLMYDLGLFAIPMSFVVAGILGGSAATLVKKVTGIDARGRLLELAVVIATCFLTVLTWGLIQAFFGNNGACYGALGTYNSTTQDLESASMIKAFQVLVLKPAKAIYLSLDHFVFSYTGSWLRAILCQRTSIVSLSVFTTPAATDTGKSGCFEHVPRANENFFLQEYGGEKCAADLLFILSLYHIAILSFAVSALAKHQERRQRRDRVERRPLRQVVRNPIRRPEQHLHQD